MLCVLSHKTHTQPGRLGDIMDPLQQFAHPSVPLPSLLHRILLNPDFQSVHPFPLTDKEPLFYSDILFSIKAARDVVVTGSPIRVIIFQNFRFPVNFLFPDLLKQEAGCVFQSFTDSLCIFFIRCPDHIRRSIFLFSMPSPPEARQMIRQDLLLHFLHWKGLLKYLPSPMWK